MPKDKLQVTFRSRSVAIRQQFICLFETQLDFWDTIETIREIRDSSVQVEPGLAGILIKAKILKTAGSQRNLMGAAEGEHFDEFLRMLEEREVAIDADE